MENEIYSAKSIEDAITEACSKLGLTSDQLEYEVVDEGSVGGFLKKARPAEIRAWKKGSRVSPIHTKTNTETNTEINSEKTAFESIAKEFLSQIFRAMNLEVEIITAFDEAENSLDVVLTTSKAGVLIGKHGVTLDSLQYITSLVVNKERRVNESYIRVKLDSENYRERRIETLNNLAQSVALKVKQTHRPSYLEPMNPYERRIIHTALQNNEFVTTSSQGDEPYRKVVVLPRRR